MSPRPTASMCLCASLPANRYSALRPSLIRKSPSPFSMCACSQAAHSTRPCPATMPLPTSIASAVKDGDAVVFGPGNSVSLSAPTSACGVLLLAANPIGEPISRMGPFVMNTDAEIRQAIDDYRNGRLGEIPGAELRYAETQAARAAEDRCTGDDSCQAADRP
eukprot:m.88862 g.88862  ORF g.88862 m.88862 type:complete len:163 (-) comp8515_c0_seq6:84-572(-)